MSFCVMDAKCVVFDTHTELPGYIGASNGPLCYACIQDWRALFNKLRFDFYDLTQLFPVQNSPAELGKMWRPKPESKEPVNAAAFGLREDLVMAVRIAAGALRKQRQLLVQQNYPGRDGWRLDEDTRWLAEHVQQLAGVSDVVWPADGMRPQQTVDGLDLLARLRSVHLRARRMCGTEPAVVAVPGYCPGCGAPRLARHDDDTGRYWCRGCRKQLSNDDYVQLASLSLPLARNPLE